MTGIRCLSNKRGFTIVEALIASLVTAIGLFASGTAIYAQFTALNENREKTIATLTAQGEIEFLRGQPFGNITTRAFYKNEAPGLEYLHYGSGDGQGDIVVDPVVANPDGFTGDSYIKKVSVIVKWNSTNGRLLQKTIATLMTDHGINRQ